VWQSVDIGLRFAERSAGVTHRERVLSSLSHREPDRVPLDFGGTIDTSIAVAGYERLKKRYRVEAENRISSMMMQVVDIDERILKELDIDTRPVFPGSPAVTFIEKNRYVDEWGRELVMLPGTSWYDQLRFPLQGDITPSDVSNYRWPDASDPVRTKGLKERVQQIRRETDCASILYVPAPIIHPSQYLRGYEDWYVDCASNKKLLLSLFDAVFEVTSTICTRALEEVGSEVDVVFTADDLGAQNGLLIQREMYRELIKPYHKRYFQLIHDRSPAKLLFHSCGSIVDILGDLVDIGVDALTPVQVSARGMDTKLLKRAWGGKLVFWGGIDTQHVLPHGSVDDVKAEVERRIEDLGPDGGYVLCAVHNVQPEVPTENIVAMYRHAREYVPTYAGGHA
jgi:uroporphyrinogen decarboxylase